MIVVMIRNGDSGDYRGIGLLEPLWKVLEIIMDRRLDSIEFNDCLHGFLPKHGTGTATTETSVVGDEGRTAAEDHRHGGQPS